MYVHLAGENYDPFRIFASDLRYEPHVSDIGGYAKVQSRSDVKIRHPQHPHQRRHHPRQLIEGRESGIGNVHLPMCDDACSGVYQGLGALCVLAREPRWASKVARMSPGDLEKIQAVQVARWDGTRGPVSLYQSA